MTDAFNALTHEERREIGDQLGQIVMYFANAAREARWERAEAVARANEAEAILDRYRYDGVHVSNVAALSGAQAAMEATP